MDSRTTSSGQNPPDGQKPAGQPPPRPPPPRTKPPPALKNTTKHPEHKPPRQNHPE